MNTEDTEFGYSPELSDAPASIARVAPDRVLVLGPKAPVDLSAEARLATLPAPVMPAGTYVFRSPGSVDVLLCLDGTRPTAAVVAKGVDLDAGDWLVQASRWFAHLWGTAQPVGPPPAFSRGDYVHLLGSTDIGLVEEVRRHDEANLYVVSIAGVRHTVGERGLARAEISDDDPVRWLYGPVASSRELATALTVTKLTNPLTDTVYSYLSSKTVFRPYQFRPVLRLLTSSSNRLLIADEVGLGKTIEAGLVWTELEARSTGFSRVLVVCPATLVSKWQAEMRNRFDRNLAIVGRQEIDELVGMLERDDHDKPFFGVVSLERMRNARLLERLTELAPRFDLVIVDEAHALRNPSSLSHALGLSLSEWADALLFLSATPLNLHSGDLHSLLRLLKPDEFGDKEVFPVQLEPNRYLNALASGLLERRPSTELLNLLEQVERCHLGAAIAARSEFRQLEELLQSSTQLDASEVALARRLVFELHTLSSVLTRTRKIDLPADKAVREPWHVDVAWTEPERTFYEAVLDWARRRTTGKKSPIGFRTQMPLRQAASCLPAARQLLMERDPHLFMAIEQDDLDDLADLYAPEEYRDLDEHDIFANAFVARAAALLGAVDTKFDQFAGMLQEANRNNVGQVLVFSFFRRTLAYLHARLVALGHSVAVMDGGTPMPRRQELMREFRAGKFDILLCSEVGSEGLDFEFCGMVVNYDLPWNPMKVEQRIGRIDRFGQTREKIFIANFRVPETIETQIFERLYERINVFRESIGDLEPILRDELNELHHIALDPNLTRAERERRATELAVAVEEKRHQLDDLSDARTLLSGVDQLLIEGFEEETTSRGRFVGPAELRILVEEFARQAGGGRLRVDKKTKTGDLYGERELADAVSRFGGNDGSIFTLNELTRMLRDGDPVPVTFDNDVASHAHVDLLSLRHPIVRSAAKYFARQGTSPKHFASVAMPMAELAEAIIVLYLAETTGVRPSLELWPVAVDLATGRLDETVGHELLAALSQGALQEAVAPSSDDLAPFVRIAEQHARAVQIRLEAERRRDNDAFVDLRLATIRSGTAQRISDAERLMREHRAKRQTRIATLHERRIQNLRRKAAVAEEKLELQRSLSLRARPLAVVHASAVRS